MITIVSAVLPAIVTLLVGMLAGKIGDFTHQNALILNKIVLRYALPMMLFSGILTSNLAQIKANLPVGLWIGIGMVGGTFLIFAISYFLLKRPLAVAAVRTLAITCPAITFVGPSILPAIFPNDAVLIISIGGLFQNIIQVPFTMIILNHEQESNSKSIGVLDTLKQPIVWAPLLAFILVFVGFKIPAIWLNSFNVLGQTTGGLALFASGITLYFKKISLSPQVLLNVGLKNIIIPGVIFLAMLTLKYTPAVINLTTIALAIPSASTPTILASQYQVNEQETASTLFISTISTVITMGAFILIRGI